MAVKRRLLNLKSWAKIQKEKSNQKTKKEELKREFKKQKRSKTHLRVKAAQVTQAKKTKQLKIRKEFKKILVKLTKVNPKVPICRNMLLMKMRLLITKTQMRTLKKCNNLDKKIKKTVINMEIWIRLSKFQFKKIP